MDKLQFLVLITFKASHEFAAAHTALLPSEIIVALLRLDVLTVRSPVSELASFITTHTHTRAHTRHRCTSVASSQGTWSGQCRMKLGAIDDP